MNPQLTHEQHEAIEADPGKVVYFVDVATQQQYAVIPMETFEKVKALLDPHEVLEARDFYPLVNQSWQSILDDSAMDIYEQDVPSEQRQ